MHRADGETEKSRGGEGISVAVAGSSSSLRSRSAAQGSVSGVLWKDKQEKL